MSKNRQQETEVGQGMVFSFIRDNYWNSLSTFCQEQYKKSGDPFYVFWKAFGQHQLGNTTAAINDLLSIQQKKEITYACIVGLLVYQSQAKNVDREQINNLRTKERQQRRSGADKAFVQAIYFFTYLGQHKKAADLLQQKDNGSSLYKLAKIWQFLLNTEEQDKNLLQSQIQEFYAQKDKVSPKIQIFMARSQIKNAQKKYQEALETLNEGIVYYPTFLPLMTQKFVCLMSINQWEQFHQCALEVSQRQSSNIPAAKALAFYQIAREGHVDNGFMKIKELEGLIQKKQGKNGKLLYDCAHLFLRICGRNRKIVQLLQKIVEKCRKYDALNADYAIEQGCQLLMLGEVLEAYKVFQQASSLDQSKLQSITGMIECKLLQEDIDDAQNQLEFVNVMTQTVGRTPTIAYLEAMLTIRKPNQTNQSINQFYKILDGALKLQIAYSKTLSSGFGFYSKLNPNFLFSISQLYLRPVSMKEMLEGAENSNPSGPIGKGIKLLESITKQIPGFLPAYLLLAKGKLAVGNQIDASLAISKVLEIDPKNQEGYIIQSMVKSKKRDFQAALASLQQAISHNFKIRENPLFMLIKGQIQYEMGDFPTAEQTMNQAMILPSVKRKIGNQGQKKFRVISFSEKDRCSIYLLYAKCLMKNKKSKESKSVMTQAISQFAGTNEQMHVLLTNAYIAVESNDIKKAMSILRAVKSDSIYFVESRKMLAQIHLKYLKSRKGYARCYYEIIESNPTFQNFKIYGDALVKINEPQEASQAYEKAYEEKSDNQTIIRDLGRAYSLAHDYQKAIKFYENNIQKLDRPDLILDLAKLCIQLKRFDRAAQLLSNACFSEEAGNYDKLKQNVDAHFQLYRLYLKKQGTLDFTPNQNARKYIKKAVSFQKMVLQKLRSQGGPVDEERIALADLYFEVSKYTNDYQKNVETSISLLNQCLKINPEHEKALELLADLYLRSGMFDKSQSSCEVLLKVNPKNDQAGSILAQILLKSNQYDRAIDQFKRILDQEPDKYPVLAKLIDFFRRNNQLIQAKAYIEAAQNKAHNLNDAGLCFCRGLYHKYSRNPTEALIQFNKAKKSTQYAQNSLAHMIGIFLCPDQDLYYSAIEGKLKIVHPQNVRICESLLREMQNKASYHRYVVMESFVFMMSGKNKNLEDIGRKLVDVLAVRNQYPPAMLAMAIVKFLLKKDVEGNNFLKLCDKITYQPQFGEELQQAWLLHAQSYIQIKKFDNAEELLRILLRQNKSCGKAQELMGLIRQKEQAYADASQFYEKAFILTSRKSPQMGYRLAYTFFKAKRYIECLEICRQVLEVNPSYQAIKVDIQQNAIMALR